MRSRGAQYISIGVFATETLTTWSATVPRRAARVSRSNVKTEERAARTTVSAVMPSTSFASSSRPPSKRWTRATGFFQRVESVSEAARETSSRMIDTDTSGMRAKHAREKSTRQLLPQNGSREK